MNVFVLGLVVVGVGIVVFLFDRQFTPQWQAPPARHDSGPYRTQDGAPRSLVNPPRIVLLVRSFARFFGLLSLGRIVQVYSEFINLADGPHQDRHMVPQGDLYAYLHAATTIPIVVAALMLLWQSSALAQSAKRSVRANRLLVPPALVVAAVALVDATFWMFIAEKDDSYWIVEMDHAYLTFAFLACVMPALLLAVRRPIAPFLIAPVPTAANEATSEKGQQAEVVASQPQDRRQTVLFLWGLLPVAAGVFGVLIATVGLDEPSPWYLTGTHVAASVGILVIGFLVLRKDRALPLAALAVCALAPAMVATNDALRAPLRLVTEDGEKRLSELDGDIATNLAAFLATSGWLIFSLVFLGLLVHYLPRRPDVEPTRRTNRLRIAAAVLTVLLTAGNAATTLFVGKADWILFLTVLPAAILVLLGGFVIVHLLARIEALTAAQALREPAVLLVVLALPMAVCLLGYPIILCQQVELTRDVLGAPVAQVQRGVEVTLIGRSLVLLNGVFAAGLGAMLLAAAGARWLPIVRRLRSSVVITVGAFFGLAVLLLAYEARVRDFVLRFAGVS